MKLVEHAVTVILIIVGLINFTPVLGVLSAEKLARAYGISEPSGDVAVLLRHRAVLFGIVGGFILVAAFVPGLQLAAVVMAAVSMLSFIVLVPADAGPAVARVRSIDVAATILLCGVPGLWLVFGGPG